MHGHSLEIEVCKRNVRSGSRPHSRISRSEASFLLYFILFFIKAAKKLVVEPPMTVHLSLISLLTDFSLSHRDNPTSRHGVFRDLTIPRKVHYKTGRKHPQDAVFWILFGRAQEKGIAFCKRNRVQSSPTAPSHQTVLDV